MYSLIALGVAWELTRAAVAVSIAKASLTTRSLCTTGTVGSRVTRLLIRLGFVVTGLIATVEGFWASALSAELNDDVLTSITPEGGLTLPVTMLLVSVVALAISSAVSKRALSLVGVLDVHLHTAADQGTE